MTKKVDDLLETLEVKAKEASLSNSVEELQKEVLRLRKTLESYGIKEEMHVTNVEYICQKGIDDLKHAAMSGLLDSDMTKVFDLLHKNLRMSRGPLNKKEVPSKKTTEAELLRIVNSGKE